ncbi:MAG: glycosyltransferase [Gammaproteobacteria bacterium]|nr:glycosyltransferase [Gammaproteobacteria bacterium]
MMNRSDFYLSLRNYFDTVIEQKQQQQLATYQSVRIDLHCHDHHSDRPDELWGRILNLPETWLKTGALVKQLRSQHCDLITITNHNNARSCWHLLDKGEDLLVGAEFTCHFADEDSSVHVLAYGFTPEQEVKLNKLRKNIYHFAAYANEHFIPTVLPHPLFFYNHSQRPQLTLLEKLACLFQRFEVLNGQRGYWQNALTLAWVESLNEEKITHYGRRHGLDPYEFCRQPMIKSMTGGSDDHNGIFAGSCGTLLQIPVAARGSGDQPLSVLALEALRCGLTTPYGSVGEDEKLSVTFLDYFTQVASHMKDPGLTRMLLHQGSVSDKLFCLGVGNAIHELQRHNYTMKFLQAFHHAIHGKKPGALLRFKVGRDYKPILGCLTAIANARREQSKHYQQVLRTALPEIYQLIMKVIVQRLEASAGSGNSNSGEKRDREIDFSRFINLSPQELAGSLEVPSHFRALFTPVKKRMQEEQAMIPLNLAKVFDDLSFPTLSMSLLLGAFFTSSKVLHANRSFLNELAESIGKHQHPKRILWLSDTFDDQNGVANSMQSYLKAIQKYNYPIDILVCHDHLKPQEHLLVIRPLTRFSAPSLSSQRLFMPNLMEIQKLFEQGSYDRILCSTELLMGPVALYLQRAFSVPAYFFMHTDWLDYLKYSTDLNVHLRDRFRRLLRIFYQQFNGIFVLNSDHRRWLSSHRMMIPSERLFLTRHWLNPDFTSAVAELQRATARRRRIASGPILIYAGRLSDEKGVMLLRNILNKVRKQLADAQLWIAGSGVAEKRLQRALPDARFLGWVTARELAGYYLQADMMIMPSRFDTFGNVVLEAMHCHLPVAAFNVKGPKDIIENGVSGILAENSKALSQQVVAILKDPHAWQEMSQAAYQRSLSYSAEPIMEQMLNDLGLPLPEVTVQTRHP